MGYIAMIKGWKLNPEWVRLMDEKNKKRLYRRVAGKVTVVETQEDRDKAAETRAKIRNKLDKMLKYGFAP